MHSLEMITMDKVVYRRENSSVQDKLGYDELAKIWSRPTGSSSDLEKNLANQFQSIVTLYEYNY